MRLLNLPAIDLLGLVACCIFLTLTFQAGYIEPKLIKRLKPRIAKFDELVIIEIAIVVHDPDAKRMAGRSAWALPFVIEWLIGECLSFASRKHSVVSVKILIKY